ncbi:zinc finger protein [Macleaya cordata]|uniref:RING-type E3 ubiquitin transferase n=1 Tax=Macleaya cordata TaxID=56857 RepID=A0A200R5Z5_MACCD|nr:zinc finger protein [Macleaya cordata]
MDDCKMFLIIPSGFVPLLSEPKIVIGHIVMEHRRLFSTPEMFEMDHDQNPNPLHAEHSCVHLGRTRAADNGSSVFPVENMSIGGINFTSQRRSSNEYSSSSSTTESSHRNSGRRSNEYCSPSISMELPPYQVTTSGPTYDPLLHPTAGGSSWPVPPNYADQPSSSHYRHVNHGISGGSFNPTIGDVRGPCKRKRPAVSVVCERGSTSRYYNAASTTDVSISPDLQSEKPQHWPWDPMSAASRYRGSSLSIPGEGSQRNVRSRTTLDLELNLPRQHVSSNPPGSQRNVRSRTTLDLELTLPRPHVSSNPSHHLHSTGRPVNQNDTVDFAGMSASATTHEWNYIPVSPAARGRLLASDTSGFGHAANQFPVGSCSSSGTLEIGGYNNDLTSSRTPVVPPQNLHVPPMQAVRGGRSSYAQRALPAYGATSSRPHVGYVPTSENGMHSMPEIYSRHLRPLSIIGWRRTDRSERSGLPYQRLHSPSDELDAHDRLVTEGLTMFDRSTMYGSRSLLDQHRDMRLDVDNMSYEELLDLGERIGTVNTGLSEDLISKCLIETICCSLDHSQDEGTCVICLEEYKNKEVIGTLMNCGHDYHIGCITKWLSLKNVCPICKSPALKDK